MERKPKTSAQIAEARRGEAAAKAAAAASQMEMFEKQHEAVHADTQEEQKVAERQQVVKEQAQRLAAEKRQRAAAERKAGFDYLLEVAKTGPSESVLEFRR